MDNELKSKLGPLGLLAGIWEGDKGDDIAPSGSRGTENNKFRERLVFDPMGPVNNHEQTLYGLRYNTTAWRIGADAPFHEELGYWMWDAANETIIRCFMVPRGVAILAGGSAKKDAKQFSLKAEVGSHTFGICSNPFLNKEFKTVGYELTVKFDGDNQFTYSENTRLSIKGKPGIFDHTDKNTVKRIS